jgi:tetratricopeptide (TPR) repeat protein
MMLDARKSLNARKAMMIIIAAIVIDLAPDSFAAQRRLPGERNRARRASGQMLFDHAMSLYRRGTAADMREALPAFRNSAEDFKAAGDSGRQAGALLGAGFVFTHLENDREALRYFNGALLLFRKVKHRPGEIDALIHVGATYYRLKEMEKSLSHFQEALALARKIRERKATANALTGMAQVYGAMKELQKSVDAYKEALPILRELGDREGETRAQHNLKIILSELDEQKPRNQR